MPYFTFNKGRPIAKIENCANEGKILYLGDESDNKCCSKCSADCGYDYKCCDKCKGGCEIKKGKGFAQDNEYDELFDNQHEELAKGHFPYIQLKAGNLVPIPRIVNDGELKRENIFISAPEEGGKSYIAGKYAEQHHKLYPNAKFVIFSEISYDEAYDDPKLGLKPIRIKLDHKLVDKPFKVEEFKTNSLVLFDDIDNLEDKEIQKEVYKLRSRLLHTGRHKAIFVISLSHNPTMGKITGSSLMESSSIILFPKAGDAYHIETVCRKYLGYNKETIDKILNLDSRWVQLHKRAPCMILHEKGSFFPIKKNKY